MCSKAIETSVIFLLMDKKNVVVVVKIAQPMRQKVFSVLFSTLDKCGFSRAVSSSAVKHVAKHLHDTSHFIELTDYGHQMKA